MVLPLKAIDSWTPTQIVLESTYQVALLADWRQSSDFHRTKIYETNPMLGKYPTQASLNQYFLISSVNHLLISSFLSTEYRPYFQGISIIFQGCFVAHNQCDCKVFIRF